MDGVKKTGFKYFITITTGIVLGMFLGAASLNTMISYRIDEYHMEIAYLEGLIEDKDVKLKKLEEAVNNRKFVIKSIEINLIYDGDEIDELTLEKHIKDKYNNLLGKEVKNVDIDMVGEIIDKRIMKLEDREFKLKVNKILLSEVLKIWVEVQDGN